MEKCGVTLDCGHECCGYAGETTHVSCLVDGCPSRSKFQSGKDDCAICLDTLDEEPCIELSCGHIWHLECLKNQLKMAQPNPSRRLMFTGCSCAQCGKFCEHEALNEVLRNVTDLRGKVDAMILEQAKVDELDKSSTVSTVGGAYYGKLLDYGRHVYAFYLCSVCEEPYFGGTVACADAEERDLPATDRMCTKCNARGASICGEASHRGFYVWKCRYCCSTATYVCYGSTHFCKACHDRNSNRERREKLQAIPCPGRGSCSLVMDTGKNSHANGPEPENEQLLYCGWCESDPIASSSMSRYERGSPNMIFNSDGSHELRGWKSLSGVAWQIENSDLPICNTRTNFVSSFQWCIMAQGVNLRKFVVHPSDICVEVSAKYMARTDCPSVFELVACILDSEGRILNSFSSGVLSAPADYWDGVRHVFGPTDGAHFALVVARGRDQRFWAGNFGSKVTCLSARVLFDESVTDQRDIIYPEAFEDLSEDNDLLLRKAVRRAVREMQSRAMRPQPTRSTSRADAIPLQGIVTDISDCRFM